MTIAMCYISPEGVVLGADSTASHTAPNGLFHYFNHNQKLFQVGENSTLGMLTWGLGGLNETSYRTLIAKLDDDLKKKKPQSVLQVAERWAALIWSEYSKELSIELARTNVLSGKTPHDPANPAPGAHMRTKDEEDELSRLLGLYVGFCVAGYVASDRKPYAYQINVMPTDVTVPTPTALKGNNAFWGAPNLALRLLNGYDSDLRQGILNSAHWKGTEGDLDAVLATNSLQIPPLPIRDAVDFAHSCIHSTIKALKFSSLNQICGGPIELAVITTDRPFRWVRHKRWDEAIMEGDLA
jgi:hypothetical protein